VRLFLAIDPGDECRQRLASVVALVRAATTGVRWVRDGKLHVTLAFLGEVDEGRVDAIREAMTHVARRHAAFEVAVAGSGVFPDWRRPRVVWLGFQETGALMQLGNDVNAMCKALGFPQDHPFRAHLTIGRIPHGLSAEQRDGLRSALAALTVTHPFVVTRVELMRSKLAPSGSEYSEIASFPLGGI
jgi:RNA 2',3'-cyclic 3'-phosphodiesterase